ncbi:MAG: hypothetical protein J6X80_07070 [Lachnospiraceae bacterium]|nr:hypothetical protein [Lachnospiraceae bacterium]
MSGKRIFATETKRIFAIILSAVTVFSLLPFYGCVKEKTIEDYPEPEIVEAEDTVLEETTETKPVTEDRQEMTDKEFYELIAIRDPFESGHFTYCPDAIPPSYANGFRDRPNIIKNAKYILRAVYEGKNNWEVPEQDAISQNEFQIAIDLAKLSNPVAMNIGGTNSEDGTSFYIYNFSRVILHEDVQVGDEVYVEDNQDEDRKKSENLLDYVVDTINRNVSKDSSDIEKAEAVYKALASDFTPVMRGPFPEEEIVVEDDGKTYGVILPLHNLIDDFSEGQLDNRELSQLYQFILTQLNIECMTVFSYGKYTNQNVEELDTFMAKNLNNIWNVVVSDGKAYNCDLFFETAVLQKQRIKNPQTEPDMTYFGMSDALRNKSFEANREKLAEYTLSEPYEEMPCQVRGSTVPECAEDYYLR